MEKSKTDGADVVGVVFLIVIFVWITWTLTSGHYERESLHYGCMEEVNYSLHWKAKITK